MRAFRCVLTGIFLIALPAAAQQMAGMDMGGMTMPSRGILGPYPMTRDASGTSWQPDAAPHQGLETMAGDWMLMGHLMLEGIYDSQSGPRGADKTYLAGMLMGMARRDFGGGDTLNLRLMLSPDAFMGKSGYPLLLATGETANGTAPLIDRQHPHDLVMEMSASYSHRLSEEASAFLYVGYPGEPALGPTAFMHRASAMDMPDAPITHHWLDSTHITFGVVTAGLVEGDWKLEASQFTGREPDQNRFDFDPIRLDSTSLRLSWNPDTNWSLQTSWGALKSPEQLVPQQNENRVTASATYVDGPWAATLAWGLKEESGGHDLNGFLAEAEYKPADPWTLFARAEWEENDEVSGGAIARIGETTLGAIHDWRVSERWKLGLGGLYTFDFAPVSYGSDPHGAMIFTRLVAD
ncbi:MAG TPA: hypothetical protein VGF56_03845 [Rhizomicrobium sp.]|jgi:hypothetical protein